MLELIRASHLEHDQRLAICHAIRGAEVALIGADRGGWPPGSTIACGSAAASSSPSPGPSRVSRCRRPPPPRRSPPEARDRGIPLVSERELAEMVDTYANVMRIDLVHQASRRAREEQAVAIAVPVACASPSAPAARAWCAASARARPASRAPALSQRRRASLQGYACERGGSADLSARIRAERTQ